MIGINGVGLKEFKQGVIDKQALSDASEVVAKGIYNATTLSAVDADLAAGNIKSGVTIFGFLGTYTPTLSQDIVASAATSAASVTSGGYFLTVSVAAASDYDLATTTNTFAANSMAVAVGYINAQPGAQGTTKLRLYMNGVQVSESTDFLTGGPSYIVVGTRALSGNKICKISLHNYHASLADTPRIAGILNGARAAAGIGVGSIKMT